MSCGAADVGNCRQVGGQDTRLFCSAGNCDQSCGDRNGNCTMSCSGHTCEQACRGGQCTMTCYKDVEECSQSCGLFTTCLVHCESASCKQECGFGSSGLCESGKCILTTPTPYSTFPTATSGVAIFATAPIFVWLSCFLLIN